MERVVETAPIAGLLEKLFLQLKRHRAISIVNLTDKAALYYQGEESPFVFIIYKGIIKLSRVNHKGDQLTSAILERGEIFGPGLWDDVKSEAQETAVCKGATQIYRLPKADFKDLLLAQSDFAWLFIQRLLKHRYEAESRVESILYQNVKNRLIAFLYDRAQRQTSLLSAADGVKIQLKQQELADLIGASRPVVSTILKEFKLRGILSTTRDLILIEDLSVLKRLSTR